MSPRRFGIELSRFVLSNYNVLTCNDLFRLWSIEKTFKATLQRPYLKLFNVLLAMKTWSKLELTFWANLVTWSPEMYARLLKSNSSYCIVNITCAVLTLVVYCLQLTLNSAIFFRRSSLVSRKSSKPTIISGIQMLNFNNVLSNTCNWARLFLRMLWLRLVYIYCLFV